MLFNQETINLMKNAISEYGEIDENYNSIKLYMNNVLKYPDIKEFCKIYGNLEIFILGEKADEIGDITYLWLGFTEENKENDIISFYIAESSDTGQRKIIALEELEGNDDIPLINELINTKYVKDGFNKQIERAMGNHTEYLIPDTNVTAEDLRMSIEESIERKIKK